MLAFLRLGMNVALTCRHASGIYPPATEALNMWPRGATNCSVPCCSSAGTISSALADFNGLNILMAYYVLD